MAKYNGNVSLGFDAFDRAYEPEIMSLCSSVSACSADNASISARTYYNDKGYTLDITPDGVTINNALVNAVTSVGDSSRTITNQLDEFVRRVKELEKTVYGEKEDYLRGYTSPAYSYKLKIGRVSGISRSQLLTI
jgi:hypothetical protein